MKQTLTVIKSALSHVWPWNKFQKYQQTIDDQHQLIDSAILQARTSYDDGFRHHLQRWMMNANLYYGAHSFTDHQKTLMTELYTRGMTSVEATGYLHMAEGRDQLIDFRPN